MIANQDERSGTVIHAKEQSIIAAGNYKNSVEHKYSYCGIIYRLPAYGWSSTQDHIGVYFINPTTEYIGGGAEKMDLVCHMDATLLDYWTSGHYAGGAGCSIPAGEDWKKVVGPIFVYFNALENPKEPSKAELDTLAATQGNPTVPATWHDNAFALWNDALAKAKEVEAAWPYDWVNGVDYPHKDRARQRHRPGRPQRPAGRQHQTARSHHRPGSPRLHRHRRRVRQAIRQRQPRHLAARRQLLRVLESVQRRRHFQNHQRPTRQIHAARVCRRRAGRIRQDRHHRRGRQGY